jgi:hypothetical protein
MRINSFGHESNASEEKNTNLSKNKKEFHLFTTITIEKFMLEILKPKIQPFKKNPSLKIEHKSTKDPNVVKLEIKSNDEALFKTVKEELNVVQKYYQLNLNEKDQFLIGDEDTPNSLKYLVKLFNILSYNIFKLDESSLNLRLIGNEKDIELISNLVHELIISTNTLKIMKNEVIDNQNKYSIINL